MRRVALYALVLAVYLLVAGIGMAFAAPSSAVDIELEGVPLSEVVEILWREVLRGNVVMPAETAADSQLVNVHLRFGDGDRLPVVRQYLSALGYTVEHAPGLDRVVKARSAVVPPRPPEPTHTFLYRPRYRSGDYLGGLVRQAVPSLAGGGGGLLSVLGSTPTVDPSQAVPAPVVPAARATSLAAASDALAFVGVQSDLDRARQVLAAFDVPQEVVEVQAAVYEVSESDSDGSAVNMAVSLANGAGLTVAPAGGASNAASAAGGVSSVNPITSAMSSYTGGVTVSTKAFSALLGVLDQDSRFRIVNRPTLHVLSGATSTLKVGDKVPTLGNVSYAGSSGTAVQSVSYQDSGVTFTVSPTVMQGGVVLHVTEDVSSFKATEFGVTNSPTLSQRSLDNTVLARDGEVQMLGGLTQASNTKTRNGILGLPLDTTRSVARTEVLVLMSVQVVHADMRSRDVLVSVAGPAIPPPPDYYLGHGRDAKGRRVRVVLPRPRKGLPGPSVDASVALCALGGPC